KIRLYKILEDLFSLPERVPPACRELYAYISSAPGGDEQSTIQIRSSRLYELADSIAGLFSHYGMNSLPLVTAWEAGRGSEHVPWHLRVHEDWQRVLWDMVYEGGLSLSRILRSIDENTDAYEGDVKRVVLFGSSFLGDRALKFFYRLSRDIQVDHFILTPSSVYTSFPVHLENPLLESWCTQMDGFAELASGFEMEPAVGRFSLPEADSLLHLLQKEILENSPGTEEIPLNLPDGSLQIHGCTSPWREVEVLKDLLLTALNDDESLKLTDIAVLAPDINVYAPFLEALFPSEDDKTALPYNVIDLDSSGLSPLIQGFLHLFSLPGSRFSRTDLFTLFDNPCFREAQRMSRHDRDLWLALCEELNIKWGYDGPHKRSFFEDSSDFNSWDRAFERIREGLFLDESDSPESLPYTAVDDESARSYGNLMHLMQNLYQDLFELDRVSMPLEQWVLLAEAILESWFKVRRDDRQDESDWTRLKGCFRDILNMAAETPLTGNRNFDFYVFRTLLTEYIRKSSGVKGRYLTQGITCSSLKPMRAIPFRRIYVLGMNENSFPGEDETLSFDLKDTIPGTIDLSRRGGDRYAFLETVLSATESLTLFYRNRDTLRGEVLQPSILVSELLDFLESRITEAGSVLIRRESIHSFDPSYFSPPRSFNSRALKAAEILMQEKQNDSEGITLVRCESSTEKRDEAVVSMRDLLSFMKNPASWYFKKVLNIYLEEEESPELDSRENRELPFLDRYSFYNQNLRNPEGLDDPSVLQSYIREQQLKGNLPEYDIRFLEEERLAERLETMADQAERIHFKEEWTGLRDLLIDPERHPGRTASDSSLPVTVIPSLQWSLETGEDLYLTGVLESLCLEEDDSGRMIWKTLEYCESGSPSSRHAFDSCLKFLLLSAVYDNIKELKLQRIGKRDFPEVRFLSDGEPDKQSYILDHPKDRLNRLVSYCTNPRSEIVPLYPELGELLAQDLLKTPQMDSDDLKKCWRNNWISLERKDSFGSFSQFRDCPYRKRYFSSVPAVDTDTLKDMLELMYMPFARPKGQRRG
ncbi:MAG: exodeoxyribonuclease V subunit gamma, partial [Spirochaetales bacterium]|nr:exodeoxyribonuclease V subunit gamma [Spirochaetales bacterium]